MAQILDFAAASKVRQERQSRSLLTFPTFKPARTKRVRLQDRKTAVRVAAREAL